MCVVLFIPSGVSIPKKAVFNSFEQNPDGAGLMWYEKNKAGDMIVRYRKGFFSKVELWKAFRKLPIKYPRAIHCRIATSGRVSTQCCHPFPIADNYKEMMSSSGIARNGCVMHNGVLYDYTPTQGMNCQYSDTMKFTKDSLYKLAPVLDNEEVRRLLDLDMTEVDRSRLLVFLPGLKVYKFGDWEYDEANGFYASNLSYLGDRFRKFPKCYAGTYSGVDSYTTGDYVLDDAWGDYSGGYGNYGYPEEDVTSGELDDLYYKQWLTKRYSYDKEFVDKTKQEVEKTKADLRADKEKQS